MDGDPEQVLDPADIQTLKELARRFTALAGTRTRASLIKSAAALPVRDGRQPTLPKSTLSDLLGGKSMPSRDTVVTFLTVCGLSTAQDQQPWLAAWERVNTAHLRRPAGTVRVREARARLLGVHAAIQANFNQPSCGNPNHHGPAIKNGVEDELPVYVPRDLDVDLRIKLTAARERGGFVLLTGDSSVGKSRTLFEALREVVPEWWLLHPSDAVQVRQAAEGAQTDRLVVWLDELQRYLDGAGGLSAATVRTLLNMGAVLVATLWPDRYAVYTRLPMLGQPDPHAGERELLGLSEVVHLDAALSPVELERARKAAAAGDARIALGLQSTDYGLFQVIAAAPQLVARWKGADPYASAVLNAAIDAARLGVQSPVTTQMLRAEAPGYCNGRQRAAAPTSWFESAMAYATEQLHGATAALAPTAAPDVMGPQAMGQPTGYLLADYLHQHAGHERSRTKVPATFWQAILDHLTDSADQTRPGQAVEDRIRPSAESTTALAEGPPGVEDCGRLAAAAVNRGYYRLAARFALPAANAGDTNAMQLLAALCDFRGAEEDARAWRRRANPTGGAQHIDLADLLNWHHEERTDTSDHTTEGESANQAVALADSLRSEGRHTEAEKVLRPHIEAKRPAAMWSLIDLLDRLHRDEECMVLLRELTDMGEPLALWRLVDRLSEAGADQEAERLLRSHAQPGNDGTPGDPSAMWKLGWWLVRHDQIPEAIDWFVLSAKHSLQGAKELVKTFSELGCLEAAERPLRAQAAQHGWVATLWLAALVGLLGRHDEAVTVLRESMEEGWSSLPGSTSAPPTMSPLAEALRHAGRGQEAAQIVLYGIEPGSVTAQPWELPTPQ
ncbi:hypothetical protein [Actinophytocola sp.]|uniref:tetratricopeptide repeat protein n=1 Tax=Actinophytocola sp. TaxID=1872138 RepID=UPI002ED00398